MRDLVLGHPVGDLDMATDARPEVVESLFERTLAVGRAFGTIVVHWSLEADAGDGSERTIDVELTTFRSDGEYSDGRRPDEVTYGNSVQEDASRRDFTCNALYLNPLTDELLDPSGGLEDMRLGRLRCVGEARLRFEEDGLRLLRLLRFEARLALEPEPETLAAAEASREALGSVSTERVLAEFTGIFATASPARAIQRFEALELYELLFPAWDEFLGDHESSPERHERLLGALQAFDGTLDITSGLALLLEPDPRWSLEDEAFLRRSEQAEALLVRLHPSRRLRNAVCAAWRDRSALRRCLAADEASRAQRLRLIRRESWPLVFACSSAWLHGQESETRGAAWLLRLQQLEAERQSLAPEELNPVAFLSAADLVDAGIPRGPRFGELLTEVERLQLNLELSSREQALRWLKERS